MKIKLYGFYNKVHQVLKDNFLNTLQDDWDCHIAELYIGGNGDFRSKEFLEIAELKLPFCLDAIVQNQGNIIIYSDMDIQFFGSCNGIIKRGIENRDILFVQEGNMMNAGFIVIKCNKKTEEFFRLACKEDIRKHHLSDQGVINDLLKKGVIKDLVIGVLPPSFWLPTHSELPDKDIIFHHAVNTAATKDKTSLQLKLDQLKKIKNLVKNNFEISKEMNLERYGLLKFLPKNSIVAEIGVKKGEYSKEIYNVTHPKELHLIDLWEEQNKEKYCDTGNIQKLLYEGQRIILNHFKKEIIDGKVIIHKGYSNKIIGGFKDNYFDWVYIDANHKYENVKEDLELARIKVKDDGLICGHDYTNTIEDAIHYNFGVVKAVDEFCNKYGWEIIYLTKEMWPSYILRLKNKEHK